MSKIEYKKLCEIVQTVKAPVKLKTEEYQLVGSYLIIDQGKDFQAGFTDDESALLPFGEYILYGDHTLSVKYFKGRFAQGADGLKILKCKEGINKYIYYALCTFNLHSTEYKRHWTQVKQIEIPLPPLSIQQEIVSVLDSFTTLIDKMKKEVELRKKQMEVYREKLFTFKDNECDWKEIQEIFNMRNGYTPSKSKSNYWEGGNVPWFRMEDIRENGHVLSDSILHITMDGVKNGRLFPANSFILATTATIGEHALIIADSLANQRFTNLSIRKSLKEKLLTKFVFHYLFIVDDWCKNNVNISGFASVDMERFKKYMFPIPPLSRQQEIIRTLDTFEAYISKLEKLITLRQKQYEYNREKLLTFE